MNNRLLKLAVLTLCAISPVDALCASDCGATQKLAIARTMIAGLYPRLASAPLHVSIGDAIPFNQGGGTIVGPFSVTLDKLGGPNDVTVDTLPLHFGFSVFKWCGLASYSSSINEARSQANRQLIEAHPEWGDAEIATAIEEAGGHYGPAKEVELLRNLPLRALRRVLGEVRFSKAEFYRRNLADHTPELFWRIELVPVKSARIAKYVLIVEPFDGNIVRLTAFAH